MSNSNITDENENSGAKEVITKEYVIKPSELDIGIKDSIEKHLAKNDLYYDEAIFNNSSRKSGYRLAASVICAAGIWGTSYTINFAIFWIYTSITSGFAFNREERYLHEEKEMVSKRLKEVLVEKMGLPYEVFKALPPAEQKELETIKVLGRKRIEEEVELNRQEVKEYLTSERKNKSAKSKIANILNNLIGIRKLPVLDNPEYRFLSMDERAEKELEKMKRKNNSL